MGRITTSIPNLVTSLNLVCGFLGIIEACNNHLVNAAYLIFAACGFDFIDGFVARALNVNSNIGKELDSLADVVSFGVLPGIILYKLASLDLLQLAADGNFVQGSIEWPVYLCILFPICAALRLAIFNVATNQTEGFIGMPTPAAGLAIASLPFIYLKSDFNHFNETGILKILPYFFTVIISFLMISKIKLMALKFKDATFKNNKYKYIFVGIAILLAFAFQFLSFFPVIITYIILSIISNNDPPISKDSYN